MKMLVVIENKAGCKDEEAVKIVGEILARYPTPKGPMSWDGEVMTEFGRFFVEARFENGAANYTVKEYETGPPAIPKDGANG